VIGMVTVGCVVVDVDVYVYVVDLWRVCCCCCCCCVFLVSKQTFHVFNTALNSIYLLVDDALSYFVLN